MDSDRFNTVMKSATLQQITATELAICFICLKPPQTKLNKLYELPLHKGEDVLICGLCRQKLLKSFMIDEIDYEAKTSRAEYNDYRDAVIAEGMPTLEYLNKI